ncbi:heat shock 70 kDa protein 8 [Dorcoceras hygrometricum]|uniref:Heat shock 70 kDa protein 8 n=1 Tax=Dorcoceras hygrometricum TaxID=472368 RepID=A0A2Z7CZB5_9LAMI|nr:heat shock 70 kDa protein 8 [Dorcoceras hygrometricum]
MTEPAYTVASDSETTGEEKSSPPSPEVAIGIDIGTSQSSVAIWNGSDIELLANRQGQKFFRSYVKFKDEIPASGVSSQLSHEDEMSSGAAIFNMKRLVGRVDTDPIIHASKSLPFLVQTLDIGVRPFMAALVDNVWRSTTPVEVLAIFLLELKAMAEVHLRRPVRKAVLTIPVSFTRFQLSRVERACAMAGLQVLRLMPEPTAVALLYAQQQQQNVTENTGSGSEKVALIFNMGAGFCDVAIIATAGGVTQIKAMRGSTLGGEDILLNMMHLLLPDMNFSSLEVDERRKIGLLRVATQDAIHKLSSQSSVQIDLALGNGIKLCRTIDREEFEEVNKEVFAECERLIKLCLLEAKIEEIEDINSVILVGGCSNIPKVQNIIKDIYVRDFYTGIHPLEAAVRGAALEGALASGFNDPFGSLDLLAIQVTPQSIGIKAYGNKYVPIILSNTTIPARRELVFTTIHENQNEALIVVFEGIENTLTKNHLLGYFKVSGIPLAPKGIPKISVCMDVNSSNILRVFVGVVMPWERNPPTPFMVVQMPTIDGEHGLCAEALSKTYGDSFDLIAVKVGL